MEREVRKQQLQRIREDESTIAMTGVRLRYRGEAKETIVHKIPLEYLVYNKYNGRIGTEVKSFEKQSHILNPEDTDDIRQIEKFLYESKKDRNDKTMESLQKNTQQRYGIVTADGVIVDGNRRAFLLNKLFRERTALGFSYAEVEHCQYFLAVILPEDATERDIQQLETIYQMGEDDKLDYNPIEKYLKCSDLKSLGFTISDIAGFMDEKVGQIEKWISTLELMEKYLESYDYSGIYTRLEKTEGPFVDLDNYLDSYKRHAANTRNVDWAYDDSDVSDLTQVCFDYIRARYEGKEFREIAKTGADGSIFAYKEIWDSFFADHQAKVKADLLTTNEIKQLHPGEDLSELFRERDVDWTTENKGILEGILKRHSSKLEDKIDSNQPLKLLDKAYSALNAVNCEQESFYNDPKVAERVKEINAIGWELKKLLDRR